MIQVSASAKDETGHGLQSDTKGQPLMTRQLVCRRSHITGCMF
jgi:hypothetical protein